MSRTSSASSISRRFDALISNIAIAPNGGLGGSVEGCPPGDGISEPRRMEGRMSPNFNLLHVFSTDEAAEAVPLTGREGPDGGAPHRSFLLHPSHTYTEMESSDDERDVDGRTDDVVSIFNVTDESHNRLTRDATGDSMILEGTLGHMLQRLTDDSLLEESATASVRRVLQLGAVLTGHRLSDEEIRELPKVRFEAEEQQHCSICLEAYQEGELLTALQCGHFFHVECVTGWMQRATQCPLCRQECGASFDS